MTSRMFVCAELIVALLLLPLYAGSAGALEMKQQEGVSYVSGGVGEEKDALQAMSGRFDLKLTMALKSGHFVSGANVRIQDAQGRTVLAVQADGPLFFAQLPPGAYTVTCSLSGQELKQSTQVAAGKQQQLTFAFASE